MRVLAILAGSLLLFKQKSQVSLLFRICEKVTSQTTIGANYRRILISVAYVIFVLGLLY